MQYNVNTPAYKELLVRVNNVSYTDKSNIVNAPIRHRFLVGLKHRCNYSTVDPRFKQPYKFQGLPFS